MVQRDQASRFEKLDVLEDVVAELGVATHLVPLLLVEWAGLEQNRVAYPDLADVVQHRAALDVVQLSPAKSQLMGQPAGVQPHPARMPLRLRVPQVQGRDQTVEQVVGAFLHQTIQLAVHLG